MAPSSFASRVFGVAAAAALTYALYRIFEPFLGPILWAVLLAFLLHPVNLRLRRRMRGRSAWNRSSRKPAPFLQPSPSLQAGFASA